MAKIAIVESKPSKVDYFDEFDGAFDFDRFALCSDPTKKKIFKKDVDIDFDPEPYDWVVLVGSEALKHYTKESSVMNHSGKRVDGKYLAVINPSMLAFKPEVRPLWQESKDSILAYIRGEVEERVVDESVARGIQTTEEAVAYLKEALEYNDNLFGIDSETTGLYPRDGNFLGISLCYDRTSGVYIDADCIDEECEQLLQKLFDKKTPIFHNAKFDIPFFEYHFDVKISKFHDTMLLHYCGNENPGTHGLKQLAIRYTPYGDYEKPMYEWMDQFRKERGILKGDFQWSWIPFDVMKTYAAMDAVVTFMLFEKLEVLFKNPKLKRVYEDILIPGCRFLMDVQDNGVPFDADRLFHAHDFLQSEIDEAVKVLDSYKEVKTFKEANGGEFNPNSTQQLRRLLFDYIGLKPTGKKTGTGADSTDKDVLGELAEQHEVPAQILKIRQLGKIKNTYIDKIIPQIDRDGRLRTNFNLHGTTSGRLSSSGKLNMQQLPRDNPIVKGCIRAKPGHVIAAMDLTTAEVYVAAVLSGDKNLQNVFKSGGNFHSTIAKNVFNLPGPVEEIADKFGFQRQAAKAVSFGIMYGAAKYKISEQVTKDSGKFFSPEAAQDVIDQYFETFPLLKKWIDENKQFISKNGYTYSYFGRKRRLPNVASKDKGVQSHAVRSGLNFLVQSAASDINLLGAIDMNEYIKSQGMKSRIFALVHDSVLAEVPEEEVDDYKSKLTEFIQMDRGLSIPGCPIGCDWDIGADYSMGKYEKYFAVE